MTMEKRTSLAAFIGQYCQLFLHSGMVVKGTIAEINLNNSQLSQDNQTTAATICLNDVTGSYHGNKIKVSNLEIPAYKIVELDLCSSSPSSVHSQEIIDPAILSFDKPLNPPTSPPPVRHHNHQQPKPINRKKTLSSSSSATNTFTDLGDLSTYHETEFDFQAGLSQFNKKHEFDQIRQQEYNRLADTHSNNINRSSHSHKANGQAVHPSKSTVSPSLSQFLSQNQSNATSASSSKRPSPPKNMPLVPRNDPKQANGSFPKLNTPPPTIQTLAKIQVPLISPLLMIEAERIAQADANISIEIILENAGRSLAELILQILGHHRFTALHYSVPPHLILMCGNNQTGAITLIAGRHLANRGARISVLLSEGGTVIHGYLKTLSAFQLVNVYPEINDLPNVSVDIIVDGMLGIYSLREIHLDEDRQFVCDLMAWANASITPVLSVDVPSGLDAQSGQVAFNTHHIVPDYTLCLGLPKLGIMDPASTGQIYLAECGIPWFVWEKLGVCNNRQKGVGKCMDLSTTLFEDQFVVPLEYVEPDRD